MTYCRRFEKGDDTQAYAPLKFKEGKQMEDFPLIKGTGRIFFPQGSRYKENTGRRFLFLNPVSLCMQQKESFF